MMRRKNPLQPGSKRNETRSVLFVRENRMSAANTAVEDFNKHPSLKASVDVNSKHINNICIRAAKPDVALPAQGQFSAVAQNIYIRKRGMHGHGTKFTTVGIEVEGVAHLMSVMTAALTLLIYQCQCYFLSAHFITPLKKSDRLPQWRRSF